MAPKTKMTAEQAASSAVARRVAWTRRTGIPLITEDEYREAKAPFRLASLLPKMLARHGYGGGRS